MNDLADLQELTLNTPGPQWEPGPEPEQAASAPEPEQASAPEPEQASAPEPEQASAPEDYFNSMRPQPGKPDNGNQGCQCEKCRLKGGRDKRGRHHKECACPICATKKGAIPPEQAPLSNPFEVVGAAAAIAVDDEQKFSALAEVTFDTSTGLLTMGFGPEWQPRNKEEKQVVVDALAKYYKSINMRDLPPGAVLALTVVAYATPRFAHDNTKSKLKLCWGWFKMKVGGVFSRLFGRRFQPKVVP